MQDKGNHQHLVQMVKSQVQNEAKFLAKANSLQLATPAFINTKPEDLSISMEYKEGFESAKDLLSRETESEAKSRLQANEVTKFYELLGEALARLHNGNILHGNLCTNSILVKKAVDLDSESVCIIGFGQATESKAIDDKAIDLRLIGCPLLRQRSQSSRNSLARLPT